MCAYGEKIDLRKLAEADPARRVILIQGVLQSAVPLLVRFEESRFKRVVQWIIDLAELDQESTLAGLWPDALKKYQECKRRDKRSLVYLIGGAILLGLLVWSWSPILGGMGIGFGALALLFTLPSLLR